VGYVVCSTFVFIHEKMKITVNDLYQTCHFGLHSGPNCVCLTRHILTIVVVQVEQSVHVVCVCVPVWTMTLSRWFTLILSWSSLKVSVIGQSSRSQRKMLLAWSVKPQVRTL